MREKEASITAYLALVLCLILSILAVLIESARVSVAQVYIRRVLDMAAKSALGEYHLPLYENYHLFGLMPDVEEAKFGEELIFTIQDNMQDNFEPKSDLLLLQHSLKNNFLLLRPKAEEVTLNTWSGFVQDDGRILKEQAIHYQKYRAAGNLLEEFLEKAGLLNDAEEGAGLLKEKLNVEKKLSEIDGEILKLMQYIDGIATDEGGVKQNKKGKVQTFDSFAKRITNSGIILCMTELNHPVLYDAVKGMYEEPEEVLEQLIILGEEAFLQKGIYDELLSQIQETEWMADELKSEYPVVMANLMLKAAKARSVYKESLRKLKEKQEELQVTITATREGVGQAIECLNTITKVKQESKKSVSYYINQLNEKKEMLNTEFYEELEKEADKMQEYTDDTSESLGLIPDIKQMERTLSNNQRILDEAVSCISNPFSAEENKYDIWNNSCIRLKELLRDYSHDGLTIDYSSIQLSKEENSVLSTYKSLINSGLAGLVLEEEGSISQKVIGTENLVTNGMKENEDSFTEKIENLLKNAEEGMEGITSVLGGSISVGSVLQDGAETLLENLLYISYLEEHFICFETGSNSEKSIITSSNNADSNKEEDSKNGHVLNYEREYILYGHSEDEKNINSAISNIIMIRTVLNLIHVLGDTGKCETALAFAGMVLGVTGLPFLVSLTKYVVLFIWAFEAALIETAAILMGKDVPVFVTADNFPVTFPELFAMSKNNIINKARNYSEKNQQMCFQYEDYLRLFLLFQKKEWQYGRSMDLIQENIQNYYDKDFLITQCITDYEVHAKVHLAQVFCSLPFMKQSELSSVKGYLFEMEAEASY